MSRFQIFPHQALFSQMVAGVVDYAILVLDPAGHVMSWNTGAERIKGYRASEIIGQHFSKFYPLDAIERGFPEYELRVAAEQGRFEDEGWRVRKDGSLFWANVVITPWRDQTGELQGYLKITRDLTSRKESEVRLADLAQRLKRSNRELEEFASVAAHDLQEPLRKINSFSDRLRSKATYLDAQSLDYLDRITKAASRMRDLIGDLLSLSRVTIKSQPFVPVDLTEILRGVLSDLEARLQETKGLVAFDPLPTIEADPLQMRQLFLNLIGNALKFRRPEQVPLVQVRAEPFDSSFKITVSDNGIGFEEIYLDRIFNVFQRLHGRQEYEGSGIGLAICRKIIDRHGGTITATSKPGEGSTFILTLPQEHPEETRQAS